MTRETMPTRRPSIFRDVDWEGHHLTVSASYYPDTGRIGEVFADADKGGQMQATLSDACTLISIALQHGITVADLSKSMAEAPDLMRGKGHTLPASPIGAILNALGETL
jgi:hypothetical protein